MPDQAALAAIWPTLGTGTTVRKLRVLNEMDGAGPGQDVLAEDIARTLAPAVRNAIVTYSQNGTVPAALSASNLFVALITDPSRRVVPTSNPAVAAQLETMLTGMLSDAGTGMNNARANAIRALSATRMPWWQANGYSQPIGVSDLFDAGGLF